MKTKYDMAIWHHSSGEIATYAFPIGAKDSWVGKSTRSWMTSLAVQGRASERSHGDRRQAGSG